MTIIRAKNRDTWTQMSNMPVRDPHLPPDALGVLTYLLSFSDNWKPITRDIMRRFDIGERKTHRIFRDLKKAGYLEERIRRSSTGIITFHDYIVHEEPINRYAAAQPLPANVHVLQIPTRKKPNKTSRLLKPTSG